MRRNFMIGVLHVLFLLTTPLYTHAEERSIQALIDSAEPGETIVLHGGEYAGSFTIDKPIQLVGGENVILTYNGADPLMTIASDHAGIENLKLDYTNEGSESPAILIASNHVSLHNIEILTNSSGIELDQANENTLSHIRITGDENVEVRNRLHGIDLWRSHDNEIVDTSVKHVKDGVYLEGSHGNRIRRNTVSHSRYGYHLMFTSQTLLEDNTSTDNVNGMMIMGTEGTRIKNNILMHNQSNPQSLGLFLYDVSHASVTNNQIRHNRVGIFIDHASSNELMFNDVYGNYVGLQLRNAAENSLHHNAFIANVVHGLAERSAENTVNENYWGDHEGLDMTGDGTSNFMYKVDPFFLHLTNGYPPFQLLFQSPGMILLRQLIHTPIEQQLIDYAPLMDNPSVFYDETDGKQDGVLWFSLSLFVISTFIMYMGVKKQ